MTRAAPPTGRCAYCGIVAPLTRDHIVPRSLLAAPLGAKNIVRACESCNKLKTNMTPAQMRDLSGEMRAVANRLGRIATRVDQLCRERGLDMPGGRG